MEDHELARWLRVLGEAGEGEQCQSYLGTPSGLHARSTIASFRPETDRPNVNFPLLRTLHFPETDAALAMLRS